MHWIQFSSLGDFGLIFRTIPWPHQYSERAHSTDESFGIPVISLKATQMTTLVIKATLCNSQLSLPSSGHLTLWRCVIVLLEKGILAHSRAHITNQHHRQTSKSTERLCGQWRRVPKYPSREVPALWSYVKQMAQALLYLYPGVETDRKQTPLCPYLFKSCLAWRIVCPFYRHWEVHKLAQIPMVLHTQTSQAWMQHASIPEFASCVCFHLPQLMAWRWRWDFTDSKADICFRITTQILPPWRFHSWPQRWMCF